MDSKDRALISLARQRGLSLIELMIGIALSLLILTAVLYAFAGSRASYRHLTSFSAVQESGRIALELLNRDIRMAGNSGCGNVNYLDHRSPIIFSNDIVLETAPGAGAAASDGITIRYGSGSATTVTMSPADNQIVVADLAALGTVVVGDRLLLSDCLTTEVLTIASKSANLIAATANLSQRFSPGTEVMRLEIVTYTVAGSELRRNGQAVAAGVTDMQLLYGIAGAADRAALEYIENPTATAAAQAVAVRLAFTVADGADVSQRFFSSVALRNRLP
jgi:prepilin-type N-terminal cleavage/methylation domain-containing protein